MKWKMVSWNVNGIRAAEKKGLLDWLAASNADLVALQETKAHPGQLSPALLNPPGYQSAWNSAEKLGYSGTVTYSKRPPIKVVTGMNEARFDTEGRVLIHEFDDFAFFNIYFPNGGRGPEYVAHKLAFYRRFLAGLPGIFSSRETGGRYGGFQHGLCRNRSCTPQGECEPQRIHARGTGRVGRVLRSWPRRYLPSSASRSGEIFLVGPGVTGARTECGLASGLFHGFPRFKGPCRRSRYSRRGDGIRSLPHNPCAFDLTLDRFIGIFVGSQISF